MFRSPKNKRGFTLIELMVAVGIVGLLLTVLLFSVSQSRARARDAERLADVKRLQVAIELYYDREREFPAALEDVALFIQEIPQDPLVSRIGTEDEYQYQSDGTDYALAIQNDAGDSWCKVSSPSAPFFAAYPQCPFDNSAK